MPHFDRSGQLVWTVRLTLIVVAVAVALGAVAVVAGGETGTTLGIIALVAAIVAIGGRWTTARSERWERTDRPLGKVRIQGGRAVIRRWDVAALIMVPLLAVAVVLALAGVLGTDRVDGVAVVAVALTGSLLVMTILLAASERVVVRESTIAVERLVTRHTVPRHLLRGLRCAGDGGITLELADGSEVRAPTGVHGIWIRDSWNYAPGELKTKDRLRAALDDIPEGPPADAAPSSGRRPVLTSLWALSLVGFVSITIAVMLARR